MSFGPRMTETPVLVIYIILALLLLFAGGVHARAAFKPTPLPYTCGQVQWALAHFTAAHLEIAAKKLGIVITASQRHEVAKCMKGAGEQ